MKNILLIPESLDDEKNYPTKIFYSYLKVSHEPPRDVFPGRVHQAGVKSVPLLSFLPLSFRLPFSRRLCPKPACRFGNNKIGFTALPFNCRFTISCWPMTKRNETKQFEEVDLWTLYHIFQGAEINRLCMLPLQG